MKANKALKRLSKIEALISDVSRAIFGRCGQHIREALHEAKAAVARVKAAVRSQPSSGTAKTSTVPPNRKEGSVRLAEKQSKKLHGGVRRKRKQWLGRQTERQRKPHPPGRKPLAKKSAVSTPTAKTAKKTAPIKKAAKKASG